MKVTVARDGAVLGAWEREDIRAAIVDGTLKPDDDYFTKGMRTWLKLSTLTNALPLTPKVDFHDTAIAPAPCSFSQAARFAKRKSVVLLRLRYGSFCLLPPRSLLQFQRFSFQLFNESASGGSALLTSRCLLAY